MSRRTSGVSGPHAEATLVTTGAPVAAAEVAVVPVHGRGGTAEGIVRLADEFYRSGATLLAPGAVRSTWFPAAHEAPVSANEPAPTSAADCVASAVDVARDAGVPRERVVLVGVSQGGAVVASAALPGEGLDSCEAETVEGVERDGDGPLAGTLIALVSSEDDPYVPPDRVRATARVFERAGAVVNLRIDPGDGHGLSDATMDRIGERIDALLVRRRRP